MDRAAIGLGAAFIHLRASINWHRLFEELIEGFDVEVLARRQQAALVEAGLVREVAVERANWFRDLPREVVRDSELVHVQSVRSVDDRAQRLVAPVT